MSPYLSFNTDNVSFHKKNMSAYKFRNLPDAKVTHTHTAMLTCGLFEQCLALSLCEDIINMKRSHSATYSGNLRNATRYRPTDICLCGISERLQNPWKFSQYYCYYAPFLQLPPYIAVNDVHNAVTTRKLTLTEVSIFCNYLTWQSAVSKMSNFY